MVSKSGRESPVPKTFKGVRMRSWGKWVTEIRLPKTRDRLWLGSYSTPEQAAKAYDVALLCLRGSSVSLNFPNSPPPHAPFGLPHREIQELAAQTASDFPTPSSSLLPSSYSSPSHSDDLSSPASSGECFPEDEQSFPAPRGFQTPAQHSDSGVESALAATSRHEPCTSPSPIHDFTLRSPSVGSSSAQPALETAPNASGVSSASSDISAENVFQFSEWDFPLPFIDCSFDDPPSLSDLWSWEQVTTYESIVPVDKPEDDFGAFCEPYLWSS